MAYPTDAADRVVSSRKVPWRKKDLPSIAVYTLPEQVDPEHVTAPRELKRTADFAVEGAREADANVDDAIDDLALQIENALDIDQTFGGVCDRSMLIHSELDLDETGEVPVGLIRMVYRVRYYSNPLSAGDTPATAHPRKVIRQAIVATLKGAPDVPLDSFRTADVQYPRPGQPDTPPNPPHDSVILTGG